jgi:integrase
MSKTGEKLLSDSAVRSAKPKEKNYSLRDGGGLFVVVEPTGRKWWRLRITFAKKENTFSLGDYPLVTLAMAREESLKIRSRSARGIDPGVFRKTEKAQRCGEGTFEAVAREWIALKAPGWSQAHKEKTSAILEKDVFPYIGSRPIGEISAGELLAVLKRIDIRSSATARKAYSTCNQVFVHDIPSGRVSVSPAIGLHAHLSPRIVRHMAAPTTHEETARLLRAIDGYAGTFVVYCALRLSPMFFVRPGTLRSMEWADIDFERAEWRIPIEHLKRRQIDKLARRGEIAHIVPLCRQALVILQDLYQLTGNGRYAFPAIRHKDQCISNNTVRSALRGMGFTGDDITPHGFRHMASTHLHELGFPSHLIEKQLAHADQNKIRAVYNHAEYLPERKRMMQAWADYLDGLKAGTDEKRSPIQAVG